MDRWTYGVAIGSGWTRDAGTRPEPAWTLARRAVARGAIVATITRYHGGPDGYELVGKVVREPGGVREYLADYGPHGGCWFQA